MPLQPKDYLINLPDPAAQARQQLEFATGIAQIQQRNQALDLAAQEEQRKQAMQARISSLSQNLTPEGVHQIMVEYPELGEKYKPVLESMKAGEREAFVSQTLPAYNAFLNGEPQIAIERLVTLAEGYENSGQAAKAKGVRDTIAKAQQKPELAMADLVGPLSMAMGSEAFSKIKPVSLIRDEARQATAGADKSVADAAKAKTDAAVADKYAMSQAQAELEASRASRDASRDAIASRKAEAEAKAGKLPDKVREEINADQEAVLAAAAGAKRASNLANLARKELKTFGVDARVNERLKSWLGTEDKETAARKEITDFLNSDVLKNLPAGAASDRDIEIVRGGLPDINGNPERVVEFLEAKARVMQGIERVSQAKSAWRRANAGDLGAASKAFSIGGVEVKPGTSFSQFIAESAPKDAAPAAPARPAQAPAGGAPAAALSGDQVQRAMQYINHPDADPGKRAALQARLRQQGVKI